MECALWTTGRDECQRECRSEAAERNERETDGGGRGRRATARLGSVGVQGPAVDGRRSGVSACAVSLVLVLVRATRRRSEGAASEWKLCRRRCGCCCCCGACGLLCEVDECRWAGHGLVCKTWEGEEQTATAGLARPIPLSSRRGGHPVRGNPAVVPSLPPRETRPSKFPLTVSDLLLRPASSCCPC